MLSLLFYTFLTGVITALSPCVLPVLPALLSATATGGRGRPLGVIFGLFCSFTFFTLALTTLVHFLGIPSDLFRTLAIVLLALFGLVLLIPALSDRFASLTNSVSDYGSRLQQQSKHAKSGFLSGFIVGCALGLLWTPCAGPILASVSVLVATQAVTPFVILLTMSYAFGTIVPLLAIAYGGRAVLTTLPFFKRNSESIRRIFGAIMIFTAIAIAFHWDVLFQEKISSFFPKSNIEQNRSVLDELTKLQNSTGSIKVGEKAPDIIGISDWINSPPQTLEKLKGRVVLIDFWTYSCINCIRTLPYLKAWDKEYRPRGLEIIGVHTPEFEFEKVLKNVQEAVKRFDITYPVAMDNQYQTWNNYHNLYWPAHYLIDQKGMIKQIHYGEGGYLETENEIRGLLGLTPITKSEVPELVYMTKNQSPETYLGSFRASSYTPEISILPGKKAEYQFNQPLLLNEVGLKGLWTVDKEFIESASADSLLEMNFVGNRVYLVIGGKSDQPLEVQLDHKDLPKEYWTADMNTQGHILIDQQRKYDILDLHGDENSHLISLKVPKGIKIYAFTFGRES